MFRRDFLKRTTAASALLGSSGVATASQRRHGSTGATVRSFRTSGGNDSDVDDEADVTTTDSTVVVDGTVGSLVDCASVGDPSVDYRDGELRLRVPYRDVACFDERRRRRHSVAADAYHARLDVPSKPDAVVVDHVHVGEAEPRWHFRTDADVAYEVEFESLGTTSDYGDAADVSFHGDLIEVEGVVSEGACSVADVTAVEYEADAEYSVDQLTVSVDAVDRPNSGDACIAALRGVEYRATIRVPGRTPEFTLVHNDDWTAEPGRVTIG